MNNRSRMALLVAVWFAIGCGGHADSKTADTEVAAAAVPVPMEKAVVGKWRMLSEAPADGKGGFFEQERRIVELRADGGFHIENYYSATEGTWRADGNALALVDRGGREMRWDVEEVGEERLVLVEDLPEIYMRDGPPRRVRNTYRRVSESRFGPMLGRKAKVSVPGPGEYTGAYRYQISKYPTMEIHISKSISGEIRLELGAGDDVKGCIGARTGDHFSESKYSSDDGKHHSREREDRWLSGFSGKWERRGEAAAIELTTFWRGTCDTSEGEGDSMGPVKLECVAIEPNERLPVRTLACRVDQGLRLLEELAINPADSERAGPYTLQIEPRGITNVDVGKPWVLLGAAPGLHVESHDDRETGGSPRVTFAAEAVTLDEHRYIERDSAGQMR